MKKILIAILTVLIFSPFVQAQTLTDALALENTQDITRLYDAMSKIMDRLKALETGSGSGNSSTGTTSAQIDSLKKELKKLTVTKKWVVQEIINRAVLDTTYAGNRGIKRRDGKPLMHKQLVSAQKQNQKIAVQNSSDIFTVQEYLTSINDDSLATQLIKKLRANTQMMKEQAEKAGHVAEDIRSGKIVVIRRH